MPQPLKLEIYKAIYKEIFNETDIDNYLEYEKDGKTKQVFVDLTKDFDKVQNGPIKGLSALRQNKLKLKKKLKTTLTEEFVCMMKKQKSLQTQL